MNLSHRVLTNLEISLLQKGLSFVPSPDITNRSDLIITAKEFCRSLKLKWFFKSFCKKSDSQILKFTGKSNFTPPSSALPQSMKFCCRKIMNLAYSINIPLPIPNLDPLERNAMHNLAADNTICIRKADKGSCTVLLNKTDYLFEGHLQLSNRTFYRPFKIPKSAIDTRVKIRIQLDSLLVKEFIKKKQYDFLYESTDTEKQRKFYTLPKIHKPITDWIGGSIPPGRPIISDVASPTYQIAKYISGQLAPIAMKHPSYIKDTNDFLAKLKSIVVPKNAALVTIDVKSLYTNIDTKLGLAAIREAFLEYPDPLRADLEILNLLEICLTENTFIFDDKNMIQENGAAMGHGYSVHYSNVFMVKWEVGAMANCTLLPIFFARFIDDMFILWTHGFEEFKRFFNILNNHLGCIKLTYVYDLNKVDFLDVTVFKGSRFEETGVLDTKVYFKPTDSHQLLHTSSFHPKHIFSSVVRSQVIRFNRICNNKSDFNSACSILFLSLRQRGYSKRKLRRIKSEINQTRVDHINLYQGSSKPCDGPKCLKCPLIVKCSVIKIRDKTYYLNDNFDCNSKEVVYIINCFKCNVFYVGQTGNPIRTRIQGHLGDIVHKRDTSIARHFNASAHDLNVHFRFCPIEHVPEPNYRLLRESKLIEYFDTIFPRGLNIRNDLGPENTGIIPIRVPYSTTAQNLCYGIKKLCAEYKVTDDRLVTAFRKHKNLRQILCK